MCTTRSCSHAEAVAVTSFIRPKPNQIIQRNRHGGWFVLRSQTYTEKCLIRFSKHHTVTKETMILTIQEQWHHLFFLQLAKNRWVAFDQTYKCFKKDVFNQSNASFKASLSFQTYCQTTSAWMGPVEMPDFQGRPQRYSHSVMGRTAAWYGSQGTALEPSHKKHTPAIKAW